MLDIHNFLLLAQLSSQEVESWMEEGWLRPQLAEGGVRFTDIDFARAQLIRDLKQDFGVNDEGIAIILDLVDQAHGLRRALRDLCDAVGAQPNEQRRRILTEIESRRPILLGSSETD
jgi:chaperone modulatory protein CbpM